MAHKSIARVTHIHLKTFRCFQEYTIALDAPIVHIQGPNGTGKTSLLESLYYACYLRSFRTSSPRELATHDSSTFFINVKINGVDHNDDIKIGFSGAKRLVKVNDSSVSSYKELLSYYRVIAATEDDLDLIKMGPSVRRTFIDQALILMDPTYVTLLKNYRAIVDSRNALLSQKGGYRDDMYHLWTQQLWDLSHTMQKKRRDYLHILETKMKEYNTQYFDDAFTVALAYDSKKNTHTYIDVQTFLDAVPTLMHDERRYQRTLFGAHLDDIDIQFKGKGSRSYASRGQQKLLVLLIKACQVALLPERQVPTIFVLDDFVTDLDAQNIERILTMLTDLGVQLIFTAPTEKGVFNEIVSRFGSKEVRLALAP